MGVSESGYSVGNDWCSVGLCQAPHWAGLSPSRLWLSWTPESSYIQVYIYSVCVNIYIYIYKLTFSCRNWFDYAYSIKLTISHFFPLSQIHHHQGCPLHLWLATRCRPPARNPNGAALQHLQGVPRAPAGGLLPNHFHGQMLSMDPQKAAKMVV